MNPTTRADLVYQYVSMESDDTHRLAQTLERQYQAAYRAEYNRMLRGAGVRLRRVLVLDDSTRQAITQQAITDARQITTTYNNDLLRQINRLLSENPAMTRKDITERLSAWNFNREQWKNPQVALNANRRGGQMAQNDFYARNKDAFVVMMKAMPRTAVCEHCQALVDMGEVSWDVAQANPFPLHVNCNHQWVVTSMKQVGEIHVDSLWQRIVQQFRR